MRIKELRKEDFEKVKLEKLAFVFTDFKNERGTGFILVTFDNEWFSAVYQDEIFVGHEQFAGELRRLQSKHNEWQLIWESRDFLICGRCSVADKLADMLKNDKVSEIGQNWRGYAEKILQKKAKKVKNGLTEIVFILDMSGSMSGLEKDTIGGFNSTIQKQKNEEGKAIVSTVVFDGVTEVIHDRVDINEIPPLTEKEYCPRGSTALLDAIGGAIHHIGNIHKYARAEDVPEHTVFMITTDGMENASVKYSIKKVREMINRQTDIHGWEFVFMSASLDAIKASEGFGIRRNRTVYYSADREGVMASYDMMDCALSMCRKEVSLDNDSWKRPKKSKDNENK